MSEESIVKFCELYIAFYQVKQCSTPAISEDNQSDGYMLMFHSNSKRFPLLRTAESLLETVNKFLSMSLPKIAIFASIDNSANIFAFSILSVFCLAVKTVIQFYNLYSHISLMTRQSNVNLCNQQRCLTLPIILTAQWKRVKKKIEAYKDNLLLSSDGELRLIIWLLRKNKMR